MTVMNSSISASRIETIREILLASGWTEDDGAYLAPEHIRHAVAQQYGRGHLYLWDAINAQMRFDCMVVHDARPTLIPVPNDPRERMIFEAERSGR